MSMEDLARRAVACKRWRWMPGMKARTADSKVPVLVCRTEGLVVVQRHRRPGLLELPS